jgi:hypothetical protein
MMRILILTDSLTRWALKLNRIILDSKITQKSGSFTLTMDDSLMIVVSTRFSEDLKAYRWTNIILDKPVPLQFEYDVLVPMLRHGIERTQWYFGCCEEAGDEFG